MQNTYLYIRFSDDKQAQGTSYARQLRYARDYCPTLIEDSTHIFFDSGKSAYSGANIANGGELRRFYDAVADGSIPKGSTLLVEDLDRLSRDGMWIASAKLRELTDNGIAVVTLRDKKRYEGVLTISDALTSLIKQELAHEESRKKSSRVAQSYAKRYSAAREGKKIKVLLPGWIEWISPTEYKFREAEAAVVRRIFAMAAEGYSYGAIAKTLNKGGIAPFRSRGKDKLWISATVFGIVKGRAAIGTYAPGDGGLPIDNYFPAVVPLEVFDAAQGARAERKEDGITRASAAVNLWGKIAHCGVCGRLMHFLPKGRNNKRYLVCSGKVSTSCKALNVNADKAELVFRELLVNVVNADYFTGDSGKQAMQEVLQLAGQLAEHHAKKTRLVALLEDDPLPEVVAAIRKTNLIIAETEAQKAGLELSVSQSLKIETSKAALMETIDLVSAVGRMEANALLRRLKIKAHLVRSEQLTSYRVRQEKKIVLHISDRDGAITSAAFSKDVAIRMFEQGETSELEYNLDLDELIADEASS
jgi:DNA invertase Pin-like site-specific DNA recombinase